MNVRYPNQRGAALLIALIAVALASVIALGLVERSQRALARTEALVATERSWQYARGMQALVAETLRRARSGEIDPIVLDGAWSEPYEVPGGVIQGRLLDRNGLFNVNALAHPDAARADRAAEAFARLLEALGLDPVIADELNDWLEGARMPRPGSAADDWYMRLNPPYRTAGTTLAHESELAWLRSVDEEVLATLSDHVTALPDTALQVNVNAATAVVVASLIAELDVAQARRVLADGPFADRQAFLSHPLIEPFSTPVVSQQIVTEGRWYLAHARVVLDGIERDYFGLLSASGPGYDEFRYFSQGVP